MTLPVMGIRIVSVHVLYVFIFFVVRQEDSLITVKASLRRTNVATKLRLTYIKDTYVDLKLQYKACT